ncbi:MAG TPA: hypothetical protein VGF97_13455 [Rhizomicrobium sp.]
MAILQDALARIANEELSVFVSNLPGVKSVDGSKLSLKAVGRSNGLLRTSSELFFDWGLDHEWALDFADKVDVLLRSGHPGHQYLEIIGTEDATVLVSSDEYPDSLVP